MNIILLSGGSGKRLWPLSNDVRSKQFIPFFKTQDGSYESMAQRMYRKIREVDAGSVITIATSKSQVSELKNQLGEDIGISVEPCRKDTFPAIALAACYLKDIQHVDEEDVVVVCPVDPYVDDDFFVALSRLSQVVKDRNVNLALLGMKATEPSEKFGYIIPTELSEVSGIECFKEKPKKAVAEEYLKRGALWNMGVFAFRLKYLLKKAHELIDFEDYDDLYLKYNTLEKISFDYAVAEHEENTAVMRFQGRWDDLGTWESLTDAMPEKIIGQVVCKNCDDVRAINELDVPVVAIGLSNVLVAASPEGILVSSVSQSNDIKPIVEEIETQAIRYAEKSWGKYQVLDMSPDSLTVNILLKAGHKMSYHSHSRRDEVWTIVSGTGTVVVDGMSQHVHAGDVVSIAAGCRHTITAIEDLKIIEVQLGKAISVLDKKKYEYEN